MVTEDSFVRAQERLNRARMALQHATDDLSVEAESGPYAAAPGATVTACRRCIEHAAASVFVLHEVPPPDGAPDVESEAAQDLFAAVEATFPDRFDGRRTARLLVLADLWVGVHPASETGVPVGAGTVAPDDLFDATDGEVALDYATEAKRLATRHMDQAGRQVYGRG